MVAVLYGNNNKDNVIRKRRQDIRKTNITGINEPQLSKTNSTAHAQTMYRVDLCIRKVDV